MEKKSIANKLYLGLSNFKEVLDKIIVKCESNDYKSLHRSESYYKFTTDIRLLLDKSFDEIQDAVEKYMDGKDYIDPENDSMDGLVGSIIKAVEFFFDKIESLNIFFEGKQHVISETNIKNTAKLIDICINRLIFQY